MKKLFDHQGQQIIIMFLMFLEVKFSVLIDIDLQNVDCLEIFVEVIMWISRY